MADPIEPPDGTPIATIEYETPPPTDPTGRTAWRYNRGPGAIIGSDVYVPAQVPRLVTSAPDQNGVTFQFRASVPGYALNPDARPIVR